jgi:hypothetical protein
MPALTPVIIPVDEPIAAILGVRLLQLPPGMPSVSMLEVLSQITRAPEIGTGTGLMVTT